jgi:AcrR family transcriptional regulator
LESTLARTATTDRRVRRTRSLLRAALIELILERGYDRVTVQDILDRADVGRSTFYSHYQSKDELLLSGLRELEETLRERMASPESRQHEHATLMAPLQPLFEHAQDHHALFQAMHPRRAGGPALRAGRAMLYDVMATHLRRRLAVTDEGRLDLAVTFVINGLFGVVIWWLDTQPQRSAESVYADFDRLATQGVRAYLR